MTSQEKAKEITSRFEILNGNYTYGPHSDEAKLCALICCDEIIKAINNYKGSDNAIHNIKYFNDVKTEIEKL